MGSPRAVPRRREGSGLKCFRPGATQENLAPVCPVHPWEGPQALELNSPDFLGHLNIQEPLQVTVT